MSFNIPDRRDYEDGAALRVAAGHYIDEDGPIITLLQDRCVRAYSVGTLFNFTSHIDFYGPSVTSFLEVSIKVQVGVDRLDMHYNLEQISSGLPARVHVWVEQGGTVVKYIELTPSATGFFSFYPVPAGSYDLIIEVGGEGTLRSLKIIEAALPFL